MLTYLTTVTSGDTSKRYEIQTSNLPEAAKQAIRRFLATIKVDEQASVSVSAELKPAKKIREVE